MASAMAIDSRARRGADPGLMPMPRWPPEPVWLVNPRPSLEADLSVCATACSASPLLLSGAMSALVVEGWICIDDSNRHLIVRGRVAPRPHR
jgi:hypothetical protein